MRQARLYNHPDEFAGMMMKHLSEALSVSVQQQEGEPLLLKAQINGEDIVHMSLHNVFRTYMNTGDLNTAIDYLNGMISSYSACQSEEEMLLLDTSRIFPALRERRYVEEAGHGMEILTDDSIEGMNVIFLELKEGYSKVVSKSLLAHHPRLTEEKVKRLAYKNLGYEGWTKPSMTLQSPTRRSCFVEVYNGDVFPIECQFLNADIARNRVVDSYLIAFTNRETTLLMRTTERMETRTEAARLAKKARFTDVVRRSHLVMPHPVSDRIYWSHHGRFQLLEGL